MLERSARRFNCGGDCEDDQIEVPKAVEVG